MRKSSFYLLIFLLFIILPDSAMPQPPLKVGALVPFTGRWEDSGREWAKGMLDAGKWLNQRGGVFGRKLEIFVVDDTSQVAEIVAAYRKLNETDHVLLLSFYSLETALALAPHIHYDRIPTFVSSLPSHFAAPSQYPYLFTITPTPLDLAKIAIKLISERSGIKVRKPKVVIVGSSAHLSRIFLNETKAYAGASGLDLGPDILIRDLAPLGQGVSEEALSRNISSVLTAMIPYEPDFAFLSLTSKEASRVLQEGKKMGLKVKWICSRKAFDESLSAFDGILGVQPVSPFGEDVPGMAGIREVHQRWHPYDSHTLSYVEGWATAQVIAEALGRSLPEQRLSHERIKSSLESLRSFVLGGLVPPLTITPTDHRPSVESRIFMMKEGKILRHSDFIPVGR